MSVFIKGMEKPEHCGYCRFRYDGICHALQKTQYSMDECPLVGIDDMVLNDTLSRQAEIKTVHEKITELRDIIIQLDEKYCVKCCEYDCNKCPYLLIIRREDMTNGKQF